eukprot:6600973-Lingulodinium_polyedra.AAC.1
MASYSNKPLVNVRNWLPCSERSAPSSSLCPFARLGTRTSKRAAASNCWHGGTRTATTALLSPA